MAFKPMAIVGLNPYAFQKVADLGNTVIAALTGNVSFGTPNPTLVTVAADIAALEAAIAAWGPLHNRGSHASYMDLRQKSFQAYQDLIALSEYCNVTAAATAGNDYSIMAAILSTSGFTLKNAPSPQGVLGSPVNLQQRFRNNISVTTPFLDWLKPVGLTSPNNVKVYQVLRSDTNDIADAVIIDTSTKTNFVDTTVIPGHTYYYWVKGVNTNGQGTASNIAQVIVPN